jgi:uncharacterized protein (TIGR02147 family)
MNSSSWLLLLIKGTKNLSPATGKKVAAILGLGKEESRYFDLLVRFNQAPTSNEKDLLFKKMMRFRRDDGPALLSEEHYEYYNKWYHPVIRSLVSKVDFKNDYALLGRKLVPHISPSEARRSVRLLTKLGLVQKDAQGRWMQTDPVLSTGDEVMSLNVVNYHKQVSRLAEGAFDRSTREVRDISALTMGIDRETFGRLKARIQDFRKEIMEMVKGARSPDRVYQLNLQFFPVSEWKRKEDGHETA